MPAVLWSALAPLLACPVCDTGTGGEVRAGIVGGDLVVTLVGLWLLWRAARRAEVPWTGRVLVGAMLAGWGLFNFVEGIVDHVVLQVHHVYENMGLSVWDWVFLGSGVLLMAVGWAMIATARPRAAGRRWVEAH